MYLEHVNLVVDDVEASIIYSFQVVVVRSEGRFFHQG